MRRVSRGSACSSRRCESPAWPFTTSCSCVGQRPHWWPAPAGNGARRRIGGDPLFSLFTWSNRKQALVHLGELTANLDKNPAAAALPTKLEFKFERYQRALVSGMTHLTLTSSDLDDKTAKNFKKVMEYLAGPNRHCGRLDFVGGELFLTKITDERMPYTRLGAVSFRFQCRISLTH